jgi:hypothetical protein
VGAEKLTRTSYRDDDGDPRDGATALAESRRDMEEHLLPLLRVHASTLHGPGVATGLAVTTTTGGTTLTVGPGVAVDPLGRHLSVADKGHVLLGTNPEPVEVTPTGVVLDLTTLTPAPTAGPHHLTLTFTETFDALAHATSGFQIFELDHTPRLALHPADEPPTEPAVVLARVTLAANTTITTLDPGPRRSPTIPTGGLTVAQPRVAPDPANPTARTVDHHVAGRLAAHPDGGLTLTSTHTHTDGPLSIHGALLADDTTDLRGNTTVRGTLVADENIRLAGDLHMQAGKTINSTGRLHISGEELLYLLNKSGVVVGKERGGSGTLHAQGGLSTDGNLTFGGTVRGRTVLLSGELATNGMAAMQTPDWGGGVHTFDLFAEGTVAVGPGIGQPFAAWMNRHGAVSGSIKQFVIDHPLDDDRQLVHACIEGAETAVYYRGEAALDGDEAVVELPHYFEALARPAGRTVLVTPILDDDGRACPLAASRVVDGRFRVRSLGRAPAGQRFCWEVKAVRADVEPLDPEPPRRRTTDQKR